MKAPSQPVSSTHIKKIIYKARRVLRHPGLDLLINPTDHTGLLIVVTPARIGNAVKRNTVRRRIKAIVTENNLQQKGYDIIIIVKKEGVSFSYDLLKTIIIDTLAQAPIKNS